ncbi:MAG: CDP-diacylglycerol diphosphatase [Burkholderiales bacterium]|nr:CDP-diacylglycerol diphosphatase [Burkholderiales bacterium]
MRRPATIISLRALVLPAVAALMLSTGTSAQTCAITPSSDALRQIVQCVSGGDCRGRRVVERENLGPGCEAEIEVWSWHSARRAVAIRDRKMCHSRRRSPPDPRFVHGLLLPVAQLCGVEEAALYASDGAHRHLWQDAWDAARARLAEDEIVLAINPPTLRSQTHLHIHLMRGNGRPFPASAEVVADLREVWAAADRAWRRDGGAAGRNYGIAVRKAGTGYAVAVEPGMPANRANVEDRYGIAED